MTPEPEGPAVAVGHFDDLGFGRLVFQRDFIPDQAHDLAGGRVRAGRKMVSRTSVPLGPRMSCTTLGRLMSTMSTGG